MRRRDFLAAVGAATIASEHRCFAAGIEFRRRAGQVEALADGRHLTSYIHDPKWDKPFLYPLHTPSGLALERGFPIAPREGESDDHSWHRGIWYGHGRINGHDFWRELGAGKSGRLEVLGEPEVVAPDTIRARLALRPPSGAAIGSIEQRFAFAVGEGVLSIEATITVMADRDQALEFGDTEDGGFGIRLRDEFRQDRGAVLRNSEGLRDTENIWGKPARWVDYSTTVEGRAVGAAIYDHPNNLRYPTRWHARGYGLCSANPFALREFLGDESADGSYRLPAGERLALRYRVVIHETPDFDPQGAGW